MISRQECIDRILANKNTIVEDYDVRSLRLFGSVARNEQKESSDVDVFVEMEPDIFQIIGLKEFLENLLGCSVDVVRKHRNNNEFLLKQIEKDGIDIIREPTSPHTQLHLRSSHSEAILFPYRMSMLRSRLKAWDNYPDIMKESICPFDSTQREGIARRPEWENHRPTCVVF